MKPINQIIAEGKRLCEGATQGEWCIERVDHQECMSYEIGPRWDGSHGFRFVIYDHHYEDKKGKLNVAKFKYDCQFIAHHNPEKMKHIYETLERAIEVIKFYSDSDNWGCDRKDWGKYLIMVSDSDKGDGSFMVSETVDDSGVGGKRAREFLASIEKRGGE